jgi:hypothetical protein
VDALGPSRYFTAAHLIRVRLGLPGSLMRCDYAAVSAWNLSATFEFRLRVSVAIPALKRRSVPEKRH